MPNKKSGHIEPLPILTDDVIPKVSICVNTTQIDMTSCSLLTFRLWFIQIPPKDPWPKEEFLWEWKVNDKEQVFPKKDFSLQGWRNATISSNGTLGTRLGTRICLVLFDLSLVAAEKEFRMGLRCNTTRWHSVYRNFEFSKKG